MKRTLVAAVSAAVLTLLGGCSSDSDGGAKPATDRDPCGLLTDDQVSDAIGHKPSKRTPVTDRKPLLACEWKTDTDGVALNVTFASVKDDPLPPNVGGRGWVTVDGVGEKAAFSQELTTLVVQGGGYHLRVKAMLAKTDDEDSDARRERLIEADSVVARDVLAALGAGARDDSPPRRTSTPPSSDVRDSEEPAESSEPETTTIPEPETSDPDFPVPCSDPDKPGCPPPSER